MDAYDRCINLEKKILLIVLPSMVEAENFSDHPHIFEKYTFVVLLLLTVENIKHTRFPGNGSTSSKVQMRYG